MSDPTPGPWKVRKSPHGPRYLCVQIGKDEAYTTLELEPADARLMAAAPKLLEALRDTSAKLSACRLVVNDPVARAEMTASVNAAALAIATATGHKTVSA
jgi:hypothetical protein